MMLRIDAPHFVAGVEFAVDGPVIKTAPILRYMRGWTMDRVLAYVDRKHWSVIALESKLSGQLSLKLDETAASQRR